MPKTITELLNGGLVTSRHPGLLAPGELQKADDTVYRQNDPAIWRSPGRTQYGTLVSGQPVNGLVFLPFENRFLSKLMGYTPYTTAERAANAALGEATLYSIPAPVVGVAESGTEVSTEISGPLAVEGDTATVATFTEFTANTGNPFLPSIVGARVFSTVLNNANIRDVVVSAVIGAAVNGRYATVQLKRSDGTTTSALFVPTLDITIAFQFGVVQSISQVTPARDNTLEVAQYGSSYFSWFQSGEPRKIEWVPPKALSTASVLIQRPLGLRPVTSPITLVALTGAIGSSADTYAWRPSLGTNYFWFLVTEIYQLEITDAVGKTRLNEIESTYEAVGGTSAADGEPVPVLVPNLNTGVRIILPAVKNTGLDGRIATHWGIYMSTTPTEDLSSRPSLATFRRIKLAPIKTFAAGVNAYNDPGTVEIFESNFFQSLFANATAALPAHTAWQNEAGMLGVENGGGQDGDGQHYARGSSWDNGGQYGTLTPVNKATFAIDASGVWANREVTGIRIRLIGRANSSGDDNNRRAFIHAYPVTSTKAGFGKLYEFNQEHYNQHVLKGGPADNWGVTWGLFSSLGTFGVVVAVPADNGYKSTVWLTAIELMIYGSSANIDTNGKSYRSVIYRDQVGTSIADHAYRLPQPASTGDFFQGSLVLNDLDDDTAIRWSLPGEPEYQPKPYVMRLNAPKRRDKITCIRSLGTILVVGLENSIERVNYLPRETSTDLDGALAHEELAADHGIPGPLAATKFDMPGQGTILVYASAAGVFLTNGIWTRPVNLDLDWSATVKLSALSTCVIRVYPREKWVILDYCPFGAIHNRNTRRLIFTYAMDKIKEGGFLPVTGPIVVSGRSSCEMFFAGTSRILTGHETSGLIYNEDVGTTIPTGYRVFIDSSDTPGVTGEGDGKTVANVDVKILPLIRTRRMYPAGIERDAREERIYVLFSTYGSALGLLLCDTVAGSTTVTSAALFGAAGVGVIPGMRITGPGIDPGVIVIAKATSSSITISRPANTGVTGVNLDFDTGTLAVTVYASGIGEAVTALDTSYASTLTGDLIVVHNDNVRQGLEIQFEKVVLPNGTSADLGTNMRLHQFSILLNDQGLEQNRSVA